MKQILLRLNHARRLLLAHAMLVPALVIACGAIAGAQERFTLVQLDGGAARQGEHARIRWSTTDPMQGDVRLSVWDGTTCRWRTIADAVPAESGRFQWRVPDDLLGDRFRLKIESLSPSAIYRMGESFFTISEAQPRTARTPNASASPARRLTIAPNPAVTVVRVAWEGELPERCVLRGIDGAVALDITTIMADGLSIDTRDLAAGIYLLEAEYADGSKAVEKIVVRK